MQKSAQPIHPNQLCALKTPECYFKNEGQCTLDFLGLRVQLNTENKKSVQRYYYLWTL